MKREKQRRKWKPVRIHAAALAVIAVIASICAIRLALLPYLDKREARERQAELLENIRHGNGVIELHEASSGGDVDYYDGGAQAPAEEADLFAPLMEAPAATEDGDADGIFIETGIVNGIGILAIDSIGLELPVGEGVSSAQLKICVGHVPQTAAIGDAGNAVIAGHRSYAYGEHFNRLGEVVIGDTIWYVSIGGEEMIFVVDEILETVPGDQSVFDQPEDKARITLYTCTPIRTASHRLLVRATRVD